MTRKLRITDDTKNGVEAVVAAATLETLETSPEKLDPLAEKAAEAPVKDVLQLPLKSVIPSKTNPRKHFGEEQLQQLAANIGEVGVLQPITVRQLGDDRYEIVLGERRWRASKLAGVATIPAIVRSWSEVEAEVRQLVENDQRADLSMLERGEGYRRLHKEHGLNADQIAEQVKKSRSSVYAALKLAELIDPAKNALAEEKINSSVALVIARLPAQLQPQLLKYALTEDRWSKERPAYREVLNLAQRDFMLDLVKAEFDTKDATLCPEAGACPACPKRTGAQPELFSDVDKKADLCTDPGCYQAKVDAHLAKLGEESGVKVLGGAAAKKVFDQYGNLSSNDYVKADSQCTDDPKYRPYKQLVGKHGQGITVLVKSPKGEVVTLYERDGLKEAIKAGGKLAEAKKDKRAAAPKKTPAEKAKSAKEKLEEAVDGKLNAELMRRCVEKVEAKGLTAGTLKAMLLTVFGNYNFNGMLLARRSVKADLWSLKTEKALEKHFGKLTPAVLHGLLFESCFDDGMGDQYDGGDYLELNTACAELGVDVKKVRAELLAAEQTPAPAAEEKKPEPKKGGKKK